MWLMFVIISRNTKAKLQSFQIDERRRRKESYPLSSVFVFKNETKELVAGLHVKLLFLNTMQH